MKRRDFVKISALLSTGAMIPVPAVSGLVKLENDKPYNIGILGYGDRGSGLHQVMNSMPDKFQVKAICDNLGFRLDKAKEKFPAGIKFHTEYKSLIDQKDLDVILIATPLYLHFDHAKAVLDSGKNLFLEKTMTFNIDQAIQLNQLAKKYPKQTIQVGHQYRYSPLYFKVKEMIEKGWLGKVTQIEARWDRNHNWRRPVPSSDLERQINWRMYKEYSGGLVAELLSHQIDFINWAFDTTPTEIMGTGGIDFFKDGRETFDNVQVAIRYGNSDMIGNFGATCANQHEGYSFKIKGSKGMVSLLTNEGVFYPEPSNKSVLEQVDGVSGATKLSWASDKKGVKILDNPTRDGSFYALEDFYKCLNTKELPSCNVMNAGKTAVSVALANKSLYEGTREKWESKYDFKV